MPTYQRSSAPQRAESGEVRAADGGTLLRRLHDDFGNRRLAAVLAEVDPEGHDRHVAELLRLAVADVASLAPASNREMMEALRGQQAPLPAWLRTEVSRRIGPEIDVAQGSQEVGSPDVVQVA